MTLDKDIDAALGLALQTHCALEICLSESEQLIEERDVQLTGLWAPEGPCLPDTP